MAKNENSQFTDIAGYFTAKHSEFGNTAKGVDWNGEERQQLCFEQLVRIIGQPRGFSLNDLGCGYGALYDFLETRFNDFTYVGYDICHEMVEAATARLAGAGNARVVEAAVPTEVADYTIASGIFSLRLGRDNESWRKHVGTTLDAINRMSRLGFAFNSLTIYSDPERMQDYLYYADPCELFDWCKRRYSRQVALLHDYGPYEFTILVRK